MQTVFTEEELLPISALQHFLFCKRRAALVHTEGLWAENVYTVEGSQLHKRVDDPHQSQNLAAVKVVRSLGLCSYRWGLTGKADVVEFHRTADADRYMISVIEYKRGKPKKRLDQPFKVQLCAQALCIEDMLGYAVTQAFIFYGKAKQRVEVDLTDELRAETQRALDELHALIRSQVTPLARFEQRKCSRCSLINLCLPQALRPIATPRRYLNGLIHDEAI